MANIVLTYKCNLNCPYCFANEFVNKTSQSISFEDFLKAYYFIKKTPQERIGIIGGEPTLHPDFEKIIKFLNLENKKDKFNIPIQIFTNGLEIDKYIDFLHKGNYSLLINCNSPDDIGPSTYNKLRHNLLLLKKNFKNKYNIGINLYSNTMNYDYIFELLKELKQKNLRLSMTVPNKVNDEPLTRENIYGKNKEFLFSVFKKCKDNNVTPFYDCNTFVSCLVDYENIQFLKSFKSQYNLLCYSSCKPIIDILPDLQVIRCFGLSDYLKVSLIDFENLEELRKFFISEIDHYAKKIPNFTECNSCKQMQLMDCYGGCLAYKVEKIEKYKKHCKSFAQ